jgi:hypothetical protein
VRGFRFLRPVGRWSLAGLRVRDGYWSPQLLTAGERHRASRLAARDARLPLDLVDVLEGRSSVCGPGDLPNARVSLDAFDAEPWPEMYRR